MNNEEYKLFIMNKKKSKRIPSNLLNRYIIEMEMNKQENTYGSKKKEGQ
jgi:hypothetical protein